MMLLKKETPAHYNFIFNDEYTWFSFVTKLGIKYEVTFIKYPALFHEYPSISQFIYEVSIFTGTDNAPYDYAVQLTIYEVVKKFFSRGREVMLFVCDSLDERQEKRYNKFNRWFANADIKDGLEKYDGCIQIDEDLSIFNSIIIQRDFELKPIVLNAFFEINKEVEA